MRGGDVHMRKFLSDPVTKCSIQYSYGRLFREPLGMDLLIFLSHPIR